MASGPGPGGSRRAARARVFKVIAYALLLGECLVILIPSIYGTLTPKLFGIPFFYWFQLLWIIVAMAVTGVAYLLVLRADPAAGPAESERGGGNR